MSKNFDTLARKVIECSAANNWEDACAEWDVVGYHDLAEDDHYDEDGMPVFAHEDCVCGHEGIRRCHAIRNRVNGSMLYPIGSRCVGHFGNDRMDRQARELAAAQVAESFVASIDPAQEVPLHRGEPGWRGRTMTPTAFRGLWRLGLLDPVDDCDAVRDCDDALDCITAASRGSLGSEMLRRAHALFEVRARPRIMASLPPR